MKRQKSNRKTKIQIGLLALCTIVFSQVVLAHNKVVVIPMAGDDAKVSAFRIVPTDDDPPVAGRGRLEYTADPKPSGTSLWGKVCDDCFEATACSAAPITPTTHSAAQAVCRDLGFDSGLVDQSDISATTPSNFYSLDDVRCPDGALSFSQCTSSVEENCVTNEEVFIECFTANNAPEIRFDGFTWSCATGVVGSLPAFPNSQYFDIDDGNSLNPVLITAAFAAGEMRQIFTADHELFQITLRDENPFDSFSYSHHNCPSSLSAATQAFEFEVTGKGLGLTWLVSGGWFVENNVFNFNELVFKLKTPQ